MRLLVQRVARATAEVGSLVESRIGPGLVLTLALTVGDSIVVAQQLAGKVLNLNLWPELLDPDAPWKTNVVDNGYEILVLLQPSLCATFPKLIPNQDRSLGLSEAKPILEAFAGKLKVGYQEEMVVLAPLDAPSMRLEIVSEGASTFVLGAGDGKGAAAAVKAAVAQEKAVAEHNSKASLVMKPEIGVVTKALQNIRTLSKNKATLESARVFQVLGQEVFRAALSEAASSESDAFAEALDAAAHAFSQKQREQVMLWTGLQLSAEATEMDQEGAPEVDEQEDLADDELEKIMAELRDEVAHPSKGVAASRKRRAGGTEEKQSEETQRLRPDWTGKAAPDTPATIAARQWAANRSRMQAGGKSVGKGKFGKGKGPRPFRSMGIASLDVAASLHGASSQSFHFSQRTRFSDRHVHLQAQDDEGQPSAKRHESVRLPKGTPTVAPLCPAPDAAADDL